MSDEKQSKDTDPQPRGATSKWNFVELDNGDVAIEGDGQILYVGEDMQAALEWLEARLESGELEP